jgi:hypothetical protein
LKFRGSTGVPYRVVRRGRHTPERSEEFEIISSQLHEIRASIRRLSSRLEELDERTKEL